MLFDHCCPVCLSINISFDYDYNTLSNGIRKMFVCKDCGACFSETTNTFLYGIRTPVSKIWQVIDARTQGMAFNAACRVFEIAKNTLLSWENKFAGLHQTWGVQKREKVFPGFWPCRPNWPVQIRFNCPPVGHLHQHRHVFIVKSKAQCFWFNHLK